MKTPTKINSLRVAFLLSLALLGCAGDRSQIQPKHPAIVEITQHENPTQFVGEGRLSHPAEFIEFIVTIHSECYSSALEASQASDQATKKVVEALQAVTDPDNAKDGVFADGGFSEPFSRYVHARLTVCQNTFQKTSKITLKTSKIEAFASGFDGIQHAVFMASGRQPSGNEGAEKITYASISKPVTQLYYETREALEQQALADALQNARKKFEVTAKMACGIKGYTILRFVESSPGASRPIAYGRSQPSGSDGGLKFDAIWINKLLTVAFLADSKRCNI